MGKITDFDNVVQGGVISSLAAVHKFVITRPKLAQVVEYGGLTLSMIYHGIQRNVTLGLPNQDLLELAFNRSTALPMAVFGAEAVTDLLKYMVTSKQDPHEGLVTAVNTLGGIVDAAEYTLAVASLGAGIALTLLPPVQFVGAHYAPDVALATMPFYKTVGEIYGGYNPAAPFADAVILWFAARSEWKDPVELNAAQPTQAKQSLIQEMTSSLGGREN